jgi:hypothetical protein
MCAIEGKQIIAALLTGVLLLAIIIMFIYLLGSDWDKNGKHKK